MAKAAAKRRDRNVTEMETFRGGNNSRDQKGDFPSCLYSNDSCSMEDIVARSQEAKTGPQSWSSSYPITEDIIAILSAIPSSIAICISVHSGSFLSSVGQLTCVLAFAIGSAIALHFEAMLVLVRPVRNNLKTVRARSGWEKLHLPFTSATKNHRTACKNSLKLVNMLPEVGGIPGQHEKRGEARWPLGLAHLGRKPDG
jgi:hypothetical protein